MEGAPMNHDLVALAALFSQLSLLAFGGGNTILPEMERQVVQVHHWMSQADFSALFALAQAAPGPNLMIVTLVGWHVSGWAGVLVTSVAKFGPSSIVTVAAMHAWERFKDRPWRRYIQSGLVPITAGLVVASALLIARSSDTTWLLGVVTAVIALVSYRTRLHPLWLLAAGALVGLSGIGQ
jgi:chromate transporter